MAQLNNFNIRRGTLRAQFTRFFHFVESVENDSNFDNFADLEARIDAIKDTFKKFDQIQAKIEEIDNENLEEHTSLREEVERNYFQYMGRAKKCLQRQLRISSSSNSVIQTVSPETSNSIDILDTANSMYKLRLPHIKLPEFAGSYDKWTQFHDTFNALINNNTTLNNIQKFYYLQGCLKAEAAQVISALTISDANYTTAWKLLTERFENKKAIVSSHIKGILELPHVTKDNHPSLRTFLDTFLKHYRSLLNLDETVIYWDTLLFYLLTAKLDVNARREWENIIKGENNPKIENFVSFLTERCNFLESFETKPQRINNLPKSLQNSQSSKAQVYISTNNICAICKGPHSTSTCSNLLDLPIQQRLAEVKKLHLCTNCLRRGHSNSVCQSSRCRLCHKKHHTVLHLQTTDPQNTQQPSDQPTPKMEGSTTITNPNISLNTRYERYNIDTFVLLSTAVVYIANSKNEMIQCRCLLDCGSQSNFISKELVTRLGLHLTKINMPISGIGHSVVNISSQCNITIFSTQNAFKAKLSCLVIDKISDFMPQQKIDTDKINIPHNISLADPQFCDPSSVDLLLGASIFYDLLCIGQIKLGPRLPVLQKTHLGWIVSGSSPISNNKINNCCFLTNNSDINAQLERFWLVEENYTNKVYSKEETECEEEFTKTFSRDASGRFTVKLPVRDNLSKLGDSFYNASKRFYSLENKLNKNKQLKENYSNFIKEYITLGHMTPLSSDQIHTNRKIYYLPHHGVEKSDSLTTKLRVVFDASAKTSTGISLNDTLKIGPTIQSDLFSILLNFRQHKYVLIGDIAKMYRQVNVCDSQRDLQRIVWRDNPNLELQHFRLNTVTYGTAPASFLATRCLKQLALENKNKYPVESNIILNQFYVDDMLAGADDVESLISIRINVSRILESGGFELRKFCSNNAKVITDLCDTAGDYIITDSEKPHKTLGVSWNPQYDHFQYNSKTSGSLYCNRISKRSIISFISQIFDPLGLIGPVIVQAKIIMQKLWQLRVNWDEAIPADLHTAWLCFLKDIENINSIRIPRHALICRAISIQLHGFCDASEAAYGAAIYLRSTSGLSNTTQLLCAKSRVAPIKSLSLPRLELCGALLLAKLMAKVVSALTVNIDNIFYWTDSTIVLSWLSADPHTWQTFVCNRVAEIQRTTDIHKWYHIFSAENPADVISRGTNPKELIACQLWWHGPHIITLDPKQWLQYNVTAFARNSDSIPETRHRIISINTASFYNFFDKFSSFSKLQRVLAFCFRFFDNSRLSSHARTFGFLSNTEITRSTNIIVKIVQAQSFTEDISSIKETGHVKPSSKLASLSPFLDSDELLRVGGRISNSKLSFEQKHQLILPAKHHVTTLIIRHEHVRNLHPGPQTTLAIIRSKYWPLHGKRTVRSVLYKCIPCFKSNPKSITQQMGNLPVCRVTPKRVFSNCGVDYAGPFAIKDGRTKNRKIVKSYLCLFICMTSKAVHLELAIDLSTDSFLNAFKRFVSRRGLCSEIWSDNATNFHGANNELVSVQKLLSSERFQNYFSQHNITWKFLPARSPHMGGIWEASVKSVKSHLKRMLNNIIFTYEEFYTLLTQVEAVLNSRPLTPLSESASDLEPLTPGHFIIGESLVALPQNNLKDVPANRLTRYQHICRIQQQFWTRWSREYLHQLQQRTKWRFQKDLSGIVGALAVLKEDGSPPLHWPMARITKILKGPDGIVRVVGVRTRNNETTRAVSQVCLLPLDSS